MIPKVECFYILSKPLSSDMGNCRLHSFLNVSRKLDLVISYFACKHAGPANRKNDRVMGKPGQNGEL